VISALALEPLPGGAIGLIGVTLIVVLARQVLFSPQQLAAPNFDAQNASLTWALAGFANTTVWLIFAACLFAFGYEKTGLGRRLALLLVRTLGARTITLGYAVMISDLVLAPFTPSNSARSCGTIYPVIRNLPELYESRPSDPSMLRMGSYLMWVAVASTCVTSTLFLTGLAPNLLAAEIARKLVHVQFGWGEWFKAALPMCGLLLALVPILTLWLLPETVRTGGDVTQWAAGELERLGRVTRRELMLVAYVILALTLWIFAGKYVNPTTVALIVVSLMLLTRVIVWADIIQHKDAWNTLAWFGTLIALADGLARVGFISWFSARVGGHLHGLSPLAVVATLCAANFVLHYLFASLTAHATVVLPALITLGAAAPGVPLTKLALLLSLQLGIMGIITPYGCGPSPIYFCSGYLPGPLYWRLGTIFGIIFFLAFVAITIPWVMLG
jgi:L-tartrate/succinate antiporter